MTSTPQQRGKYDDGTCFICSVSEAPGQPLVESRWTLYRIWLCQHHSALVAERMRERGQSRDEVLEGLMDSMISGLGAALGLDAVPDRGTTRPRTAAEAEEIAAAEELDEEDLEDMAYAARIKGLNRCSVCTVYEDKMPSIAAYEVEGTTMWLCPRDEKAVLEKVAGGMGWSEALDSVGAELAQRIMPPDLMRELRRKHFEQEEHSDESGRDDT